MLPVTAHPGQSVSALAFSPTAAHSLLAASWDSSVRLYDTTPSLAPAGSASLTSYACKAQHVLPAPVLDACFDAQGHMAYATGLDGNVHAITLTDGTRRVLGQKVRLVAVTYNHAHQCLFSASWDGSVCVFDPRVHAALQARVELGGGQLYSLSTAASTLVAAAGHGLMLFDARYMSAPLESRASPLKTQLRTVRMRPDGACFAVGSTEGRVAVEFVDKGNDEAQKKKYAFKCHRRDDTAYPVNAVAWHPSRGVFATGGSDGCVCVWDGERRKKLMALPALPVSVCIS
eukprot:GSChrysophyteH2.ASY1.ANO1.1358.1 assembled CDS